MLQDKVECSLVQWNSFYACKTELQLQWCRRTNFTARNFTYIRCCIYNTVDICILLWVHALCLQDSSAYQGFLSCSSWKNRSPVYFQLADSPFTSILFPLQMPFLQGAAEDKALPPKTFDGEGDLSIKVPAASGQHQICTSRSRVEAYAKWRQEQAERNKKRKFNGNGDDSAMNRKRVSPAVQVNTIWGTSN